MATYRMGKSGITIEDRDKKQKEFHGTCKHCAFLQDKCSQRFCDEHSKEVYGEARRKIARRTGLFGLNFGKSVRFG